MLRKRRYCIHIKRSRDYYFKGPFRKQKSALGNYKHDGRNETISIEKLEYDKIEEISQMQL